MLPEEFTARMRRLLGAEFAAFAAAYERPVCTGVRLNPRKARPGRKLDFFGEPVPWARDGFYCDPQARPGLHPYHLAGVYYVQEPSAMLPATLLDAQPGELVLDLCAAPGGKSTQIAAQMQGRGLLLCNEIHPTRARALSQNIERMGIPNAVVLNETPQRLAQRFSHCFDRVLVDAPCSGEGMFRKEPAALADWSVEQVRRCAARQAEILDAAAGLLKPGGHLVYSTCTFAPEENEGTVSAFLRRHPDFALLPARAPGLAPGHPEWVDGPAGPLERTGRLWPHRCRGEGHFAALLEYRGEASQPLDAGRGQRCPAAWTSFCGEALDGDVPAGKYLCFGPTLYVAPEQTPDLDRLRVLRAGLELGQVRKGRLLPAHALALYLDRARRTVRLHGEALQRYLQGQTLPYDGTGWTLVLADEYSVGWGKGAGGTLKNHFPKGLRRPDAG